MRGRRPKPSALKIVSGNPGKRSVSPEPRPRARSVRPPKGLSKAAKSAWRSLAPMLRRLRVLTEADTMALASACEAYADLSRARAELETVGWYQTVRTKSGDPMTRLHPAVGVAQDADRRLRAWLAEFGLTPSSRSRVSVDADDPADRVKDFLFGSRREAR